MPSFHKGLAIVATAKPDWPNDAWLAMRRRMWSGTMAKPSGTEGSGGWALWKGWLESMRRVLGVGVALSSFERPGKLWKSGHLTKESVAWEPNSLLQPSETDRTIAAAGGAHGCE